MIVADLGDYDHLSLAHLANSVLCCYILSTYGDGDPPDNANSFWNTLHALQSNKKTLENLHYVIFGLGNSNYREYNRAAEVVDSTLQGLQAQRYGKMGYGDDANGETEAHFLSWRSEIEEELKTTLELPELPHIYQPMFNVEDHASIPPETLHFGEPVSSRARLLPGHLVDTMNPSTLRIVQARKLWESTDRLCLHLELDLSDHRLVKYKTGDHLAIWPSNPDHEVERILSSLGLYKKRHTPLIIEMKDGTEGSQIPVPSPTTIEALFRYYLEICDVLSLETAAALTEFSPSESARASLCRIIQNPGLFKAKVTMIHMTLADFLEEVGLDTVWDIPLSFFLERLRPMQPRYYSISSSTIVHPKRVSLTIVVSKPAWQGEKQQSLFRGCFGLCTSYLRAIEQVANCESLNTAITSSLPMFSMDGPRGVLNGHKVFGRVRQSVFKLPPKASTPIVMVGSGTGVAPFRAFVQERARQKSISQDVGRTLLFMGFRYSNLDFIYKKEWMQWRESLGSETFDYWTAFSRDNPNQKVYVQDILVRQASEVMNLLENSHSSRIYVCGSAEMARGVTSALASMKNLITGENEEQSMVWVKRLRQSNRLLEDVWI